MAERRKSGRMDEKFVEFLRYGLSQPVKKKDIFIMNFLMMFFSLIITIADGYISLKWGIPSTIIVVMSVILTYTKEDVKGSKIFFIYGVLGVGLTLIFCLTGIRFMFFALDKKDHFTFISILFALYVMVIGIYVYIIRSLIKKGAYKETGKTNGKLSVTIVAVGGISIAKTFSNSAGYERSMQIASICFFTLSFMTVIGIFGFFKYYYLRKLDELN